MGGLTFEEAPTLPASPRLAASYYVPNIVQARGRRLASASFHGLWGQLHPQELLVGIYTFPTYQTAPLLNGPSVLKEFGLAVSSGNAVLDGFFALPITGSTREDLLRYRLHFEDPFAALGMPMGEEHAADSAAIAFAQARCEWLAIDWPSTGTLGLRERLLQRGSEAVRDMALGRSETASMTAHAMKIIEHHLLGASPIWGRFAHQVEVLSDGLDQVGRQRRRSAPAARPISSVWTCLTLDQVLGVARLAHELPFAQEDRIFPPVGRPALRDHLSPWPPEAYLELLALNWLGEEYISARVDPWHHYHQLLVAARDLPAIPAYLASRRNLDQYLRSGLDLLGISTPSAWPKSSTKG